MAPSAFTQYRLMQALGLLTMAIIIGARLIPALQPHAGRIGLAAAGLYLLGGLGLLLWYFLAS